MSLTQAPAGALELQLRGYRLATAEITYRLPDHPSLLQTFVWQHYEQDGHPVRCRCQARGSSWLL
jgi:uncharacterized protein Usg